MNTKEQSGCAVTGPVKADAMYDIEKEAAQLPFSYLALILWFKLFLVDWMKQMLHNNAISKFSSDMPHENYQANVK